MVVLRPGLGTPPDFPDIIQRWGNKQRWKVGEVGGYKATPDGLVALAAQYPNNDQERYSVRGCKKQGAHSYKTGSQRELTAQDGAGLLFTVQTGCARGILA